jgi:hypothetical protein
MTGAGAAVSVTDAQGRAAREFDRSLLAIVAEIKLTIGRQPTAAGGRLVTLLIRGTVTR